MSRITRPRRIAAVATAAALALGGGIAAAAPALAAPSTPELDYFADSIPGLRADSVFEAVTYERFESILNLEGTYAFVLGGPADIAASAADIDAAARAHGIDAVYTFDPRLGGVGVDIRTSTVPEVAALWTKLSGTYLNKDTTPGFAGAETDPYLFVYDKGHTIEGVEDRIVSSLAVPFGAGYRDQVDAVFAAASDYDTQSQFDFFATAVNTRHTASYTESQYFGGDIFSAADEKDFTLRSITYPELVDLLESDGSHTILFGGTWCHNTRAVIHEVNRKATETGVDTVYVFDLRLDGWSNPPLHIRDSASSLSYLYGDIANTYLDNLRTQYVTNATAGQRVDYYPGGDKAQALLTAKKLQVPYLIQYDKDAAQPITKDWIRDNGNGTFTEYMTEYWWIEDLPGKRSARYTTDEAWAAEQAKQWAFADEALAKLDTFFGIVPTPQPSGSASPTPTATATPTPTASATPTPTPSATLPATGPAQPSVTVSGDLRPGGSITVTGSGYPAQAPDVRVELHSTPQVLGTTTATAAGTFQLTATIPASVPAGAHSVVVLVNGTEVVRTAVTLAAPSALAAAGALPDTGFDGTPLIWVVASALALVAAGLIVVRRRARA